MPIREGKLEENSLFLFNETSGGWSVFISPDGEILYTRGTIISYNNKGL